MEKSTFTIIDGVKLGFGMIIAQAIVTLGLGAVIFGIALFAAIIGA